MVLEDAVLLSEPPLAIRCVPPKHIGIQQDANDQLILTSLSLSLAPRRRLAVGKHTVFEDG